jgi:cell wall-associated NlpC family hydrolase
MLLAFGACPAAAHTATTDDAAVLAYTVHAGDAIASIARKFNTSPAQILALNNLASGAVIHPGDVLRVPAVAAAAASVQPSATPSATNPTSVGYVVKAGDTMVGIASRHGMTFKSLLSLNGRTATSLLLPGQVLQVCSTAPDPAPDAATSAAPTARGSSLDNLLTYLNQQVGKPYKFFTAGPDFFDCSGLVVAGFRTIGITLPHQSRALAAMGRPVDLGAESIQAGDLIFMNSSADPTQIGHVGIALSTSTWIQAVGTGQTVRITGLPALSKIDAVRRIL